MKAVELEKAYDPASFEDRIYRDWLETASFKPVDSVERDPFVVVIPPPNVTGVLHMGHGLNNTLQDIVVRYQRMRGRPALWLPGTDHAGIATQNVVERRLKKEGKTRHDLGREAFIEETWKVKEEHHEVITRQLKKIGASVDWSRERFTLDEGLSKAVREVFVTLWERDLLYKGNYLVNWCPSCGTALSDDEVEHEELDSLIYHLRYPVVDPAPGMPAYLELATTRPETLLGDTAVAVHPEDERYSALVGRRVKLPLTDRTIPVVADSYVDRAFGTGVVKITPAHDPNDWEVAKRHELPVINILTPTACLNDEVPAKYRGLTVKKARAVVLEDLKEGGFFVRDEKLVHNVGHCYRCHTVIEPYLSEQWFVRMKPMADKALAAWQKGEIVFYPKKWENTYERWLTGIRDWCISRQLWWGHRIPAWTCADCGELIVSREDPSACPKCGSSKLEQDPDVLDTWFSSWLWPFSTLGWPEKTPDFERFYPTSALVTAYDIIFFWVARMIMAGLEFTGQVPFRDIYMHGLVRDKQGRKMSKSKGNGLDPLELVDEYGADALKFTLAFMCAQGQDILIDNESFKLGSKFANKIWNASRYILMNLEGRTIVENPALLPVDRWIYSRLDCAAAAIADALEGYRYNEAAQAAYEFFWNDFCDWYVEATKLSLNAASNAGAASDAGATNADAEKDRATTVLLDVLEQSLRLLHPLLPFVTEEIHSKLPSECKASSAAGAANTVGAASLITAAWPAYDTARRDETVEAAFDSVRDLVRQVRTLRAECQIAPSAKIRLTVRADSARLETFTSYRDLVALLAGLSGLELQPAPATAGTRITGTIGLVGTGFEGFLHILDAIDAAALAERFKRDVEKEEKYMQQVQGKLANENFRKNAPAELVAAEEEKLAERVRRIEKLRLYLGELEKA